jgi:hypothetical protein
MITVVDQVSPWLTPSSSVGEEHPATKLGAHISKNGTGAATSQPPIEHGRRRSVSERRPAR